MFEFTSSILEDIQNKMLIQRSKSFRVEKEGINNGLQKDTDNINNTETSGALKSSSPDKSFENKDNYNTSDFKSNKETTENEATYEVINAKKLQKEMEFNQFDSLKDSKMSSIHHNSPPNSKSYKSQPKAKDKEKVNKIPKHPSSSSSQGKRYTRIPGVK